MRSRSSFDICRLFDSLHMVFNNSQIEFFAKETGVEASQLKRKLEELDKQFQECSLQRDWMGCLSAVKKQNRLLGLCPIESDEDVKEDFDDNLALLLAIRIVSPVLYQLVIQKI